MNRHSNKSKHRRFAIVFAMLLAVASLSGCGANNDDSSIGATDEQLGINAYEKEIEVNPYDTETPDATTQSLESTTETVTTMESTTESNQQSAAGSNSSGTGAGNSSSENTQYSSEQASLPLVPDVDETNDVKAGLGDFTIDGNEYNIREVTPEMVLSDTGTSYRFSKKVERNQDFYFYGLSFYGSPTSPIYVMELLDRAGNVIVPKVSNPDITDDMLIKGIGYTNDSAFSEYNEEEPEYITFCGGITVGTERREIEKKLGAGTAGQAEDDEHPVVIYKTSEATMVVTYETVKSIIVLDGEPDTLDYAQTILLLRN